jgi:hypothetical protein
MRGVGLIYRLYRSGVLTSPEDIIMDVDQAYAATGEALICVRWALRKAVRAGLLTSSMGARLTEVSRSMHFSQRVWPEIFRVADYEDTNRGLELYCKSLNLKKKDALAALDALILH